jgi:hypothetical protein
MRVLIRVYLGLTFADIHLNKKAYYVAYYMAYWPPASQILSH